MANYLGETPVDIATHPKFGKYTPNEWAMYYLTRYGQTEGGHHKAWVLDQVARILKGTPVVVTLARWDDGKSEYRVDTGEPSEDYQNWVHDMRQYSEPDGEPEYDYDEGIPP